MSGGRLARWPVSNGERLCELRAERVPEAPDLEVNDPSDQEGPARARAMRPQDVQGDVTENEHVCRALPDFSHCRATHCAPWHGHAEVEPGKPMVRRPNLIDRAAEAMKLFRDILPHEITVRSYIEETVGNNPQPFVFLDSCRRISAHRMLLGA
jgi:hypothetical protein